MINSNTNQVMELSEEEQKSVYKDDDTQRGLNKPLRLDGNLSEDDEKFLKTLVSLVDDGKIDLYKAQTLMNREVYDDLNPELQGRYDLEAQNMLNAIREIKNLYDNNLRETVQMENLVSRLRLSKERLESKGGDVFII
ncbi:hypothetical protein GF354_05025 [Candidatus Peregrinibacteria bacterium]|nr:hypothetical protein [Candidatus Peregrinibacteria bacterium]